MVGGRREQRRGAIRTALGRRGFAGCLVAGGGGEEKMARRWSFGRRRRGSCRGWRCCCTEEEGEGRLASLAGGCRLRCDGGGDRAIACLREGVEVVGFALVVAEEAVEEAGDSLVVYLMKESRPGQRCRLNRIGEVILGGAQELHCGKSWVVPLSAVKVDANRRMAFGLATLACLALGPCYQGRSFACCMANPANRRVLSVRPYGGRCPVA